MSGHRELIGVLAAETLKLAERFCLMSAYWRLPHCNIHGVERSCCQDQLAPIQMNT